ncbi:MAG: DUF6398 domain-containing protein [Thermodesulfobacteriota bacterium]|jgi:hypothetical protein
MPAIMKEKKIVEEKAIKLVEMTGKFCQEFLDDDYRQLCEKLIMKMARKRAVPFLSGRMEIWAAAVIYALGSINFLFDKSFKPFATAEDICNFFGTTKSTTSQKAKVIRDMFKMGYYDGEFSTNHVKENSPFSNLVMINGLIVDKGSLPPEIQEMLRREEK